MATIAHRLELDLDVFAGPFDLLLSLVLREDVDLLEVELADIVVSYLDHLEASELLDLESATEFLVLIAALLELKSRLMLPAEDVEELDELEPAEAAEELVERMLQYLRFRGAGAHLAERHEAGQARGHSGQDPGHVLPFRHADHGHERAPREVALEVVGQRGGAARVVCAVHHHGRAARHHIEPTGQRA